MVERAAQLDALPPGSGRLCELLARINAADVVDAEALCDWAHLVALDPHSDRRATGAHIIARRAGLDPGRVLAAINRAVVTIAWGMPSVAEPTGSERRP